MYFIRVYILNVCFPERLGEKENIKSVAMTLKRSFKWNGNP